MSQRGGSGLRPDRVGPSAVWNLSTLTVQRHHTGSAEDSQLALIELGLK